MSYQPMPDLTPEQHDALREDIADNGVIVPIVVDQDDRIIDGHNRKSIADELGIDCPQTIMHVDSDDDAIDLAVTLNCARRHLTREQQRAVLTNELARRPNDSDRAIARRVGCSPSTVGAVRMQVSKLDSGPEVTAAVPPPHQQRRRPLPDAYRDYLWTIEKAASSLTNLHGDERFTRNREGVMSCAPELAHAANRLIALLDELGIDRQRYGGDR